MINTHKYGNFPCPYEDCSYVGISKKNINLHGRIHTRLNERLNYYKCPHKNCGASFEFDWILQRHLRLHNNDLEKCQYCPFQYIHPPDYQIHLNQHFQIQDFKCDKCGFESTSKRGLARHYKIHEGIIYLCLICNNYEAGHQTTMAYHLKIKHADIV